MVEVIRVARGRARRSSAGQRGAMGRRADGFAAVAEALERRAYLSAVALGAPEPVSAVGGDANAAALEDFNGDGKLDLLVGRATEQLNSDPSLTLSLGNGDGTFGPPATVLGAGAAPDVAVADFDRDGKADVAVSVPTRVLLGNGDGTFREPPSLFGSQVPGFNVFDIEAADFNGDGNADLAGTLEGTLMFAAGNGDGTFDEFELVKQLALGGEGGLGLAAADVDGDGVAEILAASRQLDIVRVDRASGELVRLDSRSISSLALDPVVFTLPGSTGGQTFIAVPLPETQQLAVFRALSDGKLDPAPETFVALGGGAGGVATGDFDDDGLTDLAALGGAGASVNVIAGRPDATLAPPVSFPAGSATPFFVAAGDLTADGRPDLVVGDALADTVSVLRNTTPADVPEGTLVPSLSGALPAALVAGQKAKLAPAVTVNNPGAAAVSGRVTVELFASSDRRLDAADARLGGATKNLKLGANAGKAVKVKLPAIPDLPDGGYFVLTKVTAADGTASTVASASRVTIARPFVELRGGFPPGAALAAARGKRAAVTLNVGNAGNSAAAGRLSVALNATPAGSGPEAIGTPLAMLATNVKLQPHTSRAIKLKFLVPADLAAGSYLVTASIDAVNAFPERDESDNITSDAVTLTVN